MKKIIAKPSELYNSRRRISAFNFNVANNTINFNDKELTLSNKLAKLFQLLYVHQNTLVTRESMIKTLWSTEKKNAENNLTHHICILRKEIAENFEDFIQIETIPKLGYILKLKHPHEQSEYNELIRLKSLGWQVNLPTQALSTKDEC